MMIEICSYCGCPTDYYTVDDDGEICCSTCFSICSLYTEDEVDWFYPEDDDDEDGSGGEVFRPVLQV